MCRKYLHGIPQAMKCNLRNDIKDTSFSISQSHISNVIIKPIQNVKQMRTDLIDMETSNLIWGKSYIAWTQDPMLATDVMFLVIFYINLRFYQRPRIVAQGILGRNEEFVEHRGRVGGKLTGTKNTKSDQVKTLFLRHLLFHDRDQVIQLWHKSRRKHKLIDHS